MNKIKNEILPKGALIVCPHCNTVNPLQAVYCSECGRKMRRMDYLKVRTKQELQDPKSRVIVAMSVVIVILIVLLFLT